MEGLNVRFDIYRISFIDDDIGGAVLTGTVVGNSIPGRIDIKVPSQASLEQGLESDPIADIIIRPRPGTLTIDARDQLLIVSPIDHPNYGQRWRITGEVIPSSMHPKSRLQFFRIRAMRVDRTRTEALI